MENWSRGQAGDRMETVKEQSQKGIGESEKCFVTSWCKICTLYKKFKVNRNFLAIGYPG